MNNRLRVGIIGATGFYGQTFLSILEDHPWFEVCGVSASPRTAGIPYIEAISGRWKLDTPIPNSIKQMRLISVTNLKELCDQVDFIFCTTDLSDEETRELERNVALLETPVISNHAAHIDRSDIPIIIPEINPDHSSLIESQRERLGLKIGFIVSRPNDALFSFVPPISPLLELGLSQIIICTYQSIIGSNRVLSDFPDLIENVIPIAKEIENKIESEPKIIWGEIKDGDLIRPSLPTISSQCFFVPLNEGNIAAVGIKFDQKPPIEDIVMRWKKYSDNLHSLKLPSLKHPFIQYTDVIGRPQPKLDCMAGNGMSVTIGGLREDNIFDYKFTGCSNNAQRGGPGGVVLTAELLVEQGYLTTK